MLITSQRPNQGPLRSKIICVLALALVVGLGGCSAVRLGYSNGPQLAWWWLDGYVDFGREQAPRARQLLDRWFDWHRASQLPAYATLLAQAQAQVMEPLTAEAACAWQARGTQALEPAIRRAADDFADVVPGLGEPQFKQLEQRYAKNVEKMRDDYLQSDPQARREASFKRTLERAEDVYGELSEAQRRILTAGLAVSPFNPDLWLQERLRRQRDTVQTLRKLIADKASREDRATALRALAKRTELSPDSAYRDYQRRLADFNCGLIAQLHNSTTAAQRQRARSTFKGWEDDLRWLVANPGSGAAAAGQPPQ